MNYNRRHNFKKGDTVKFAACDTLYTGKIIDIVNSENGTEYTVKELDSNAVWPGLYARDLFGIDCFGKNVTIDELKDFRRREKEAAMRFRLKHSVTESAVNENAAWKRNTFVEFCSNEASHLYFTLLNICCLQTSFPEIVHHWSNEIQNIAKRIIDRPLPHGNKVDIVSEEMMENFMGTEFEMYVPDSFEAAMKYEIWKARKETDEKKKLQKSQEADYIENEILPNINYYYQISKERLMNFYKDFINAIDENSMDLVDKAILDFIDFDYYD